MHIAFLCGICEKLDGLRLACFFCKTRKVHLGEAVHGKRVSLTCCAFKEAFGKSDVLCGIHACKIDPAELILRVLVTLICTFP